MKRIRPAALFLCLLFACEAPPRLYYPTSVPIVLVERRGLPIGDGLAMGLSGFRDGEAVLEIWTAGDESVLGPLSVKAGEVHPFEVGGKTYYLVVHEVGGITRERVAREFGLNLANIPPGREFGIVEIAGAPPPKGRD